MALFEGNKRIEGSRSNTHLVKSGHMSPAEEWILDTRFNTESKFANVFRDGVLFDYEYGGPGMSKVVIPKGRIVGVTTPIKDFVSKKFKTVLTLPGMSLNGNSIGVVPFNICKDELQNDKFGGNQPSVITLDYITLPYIPSVAPSTTLNIDGVVQEETTLSINNKMPWGAVIGKLEVGDYVKPTASGRFTKWIKGTDCPSEIVGQALACDLNQEPWGWTKWMLFNEASISKDDEYINRAANLNKSGASNLPSDGGYPFDPGYAEGNKVFQHILGNALHNPTGIPGLHDGSGNYTGYGKNDTEYTNIELGVVPEGVTDNSIIVIQAKDFAGGNLVNLSEVKEIKINNVAIDASKYTVGFKAGVLNVTVQAANAGQKITATYKAKHYGTHSYLDFKGVQGAFNILLKK